MRYSFTGTLGDFTPLQGCSPMTRSFSAVVKIADSTIFACRMVAGETPEATRSVTHSRTWAGRISLMRIGPNAGSRCLAST